MQHNYSVNVQTISNWNDCFKLVTSNEIREKIGNSGLLFTDQS